MTTELSAATTAKIEPSLKKKLVLFSVPFFILLFAFITRRLNNDLHVSIFGSDSQRAYGEWIQFIFYSVAGVIGIATWRAFKNSQGNRGDDFKRKLQMLDGFSHDECEI